MFEFSDPKTQAFGIDLSDLSIKIARLQKKGGRLSLATFGRQPIPEGFIEDGEIKKEEELIEIVKKAISETKGKSLGTKHCVVSLPEKISFVRMVKIPKMDKKEVAEAIKWELEANIPLSREEIYYDWQTIDPLPNEKVDHLNVLIGVLPKKSVDPYLDVLKKAGLKPLAFEIESIAISRALIKDGLPQKPTLIIDLGSKKTSLLIFSGQAIYFTTTIPFSNNSLVDVLSQGLKISKEKALLIKLRVGLNYKNQQSRIFQELTPPLFDLIDKIKTYLNFYREHFAPDNLPDQEISKILLCGGGASLAGLADFLSDELKISVEKGNPWLNISNDTDEQARKLQEESLVFTTALGLALRGYLD